VKLKTKSQNVKSYVELVNAFAVLRVRNLASQAAVPVVVVAVVVVVVVVVVVAAAAAVPNLACPAVLQLCSA